MITIGYSTRTSNPTLQDYFKKSCGLKTAEVIEVINNGEKSLSQVYNEIIDISSNNILVLCHDDIKLETGWGKKLLNDFEENPDFSIIGKAGSCYFPESGVYWEKMNQTMVGQVYHHPDGQKKWLSKYSPKLPFLIPVVTIDGLFISFDKTKINHKFDETIGKFHFYDHGFCIPNYLDGVKIGVTSSFEITHQSIGQPNNEFFISKDQFIKKYESNLPIQLKPKIPFSINRTENINVKNNKVAVIIPVNNNQKSLNKIIDNLIEKCDSELFDIFVVDYSNEKEITNSVIDFVGNYKNVFIKSSDSKIINEVFDELSYDQDLNDYNFLLLMRDNLLLINDVIGGMVNVFKKNPMAGTVSCRIHNYDNTIKYEGILVKENNLVVRNKENYYNFSTTLQEVDGNSSIMTMYRRDTFLKNGGFRQNNINGHDDIQYSLNLKNKKFKNLVDGSLVCKIIEENKSNQKIKILTGFSEKGGSTFAFINLTNELNKNGYDCTLYGPHKWHLDKCNSDLLLNLSFESDDIVITHFLNLQSRPEVKKVILSCHEKNLFEVGKVNQYWDKVVFLNEEHRNYHKDYTGPYTIIPNLTQNLNKKEKPELEKVAGIIGSFDYNKQTHVSIQKAISDGCEKIYLFGEPKTKYFDDYVKPMCNDKVILKGFMDDKQKMYDMIGVVYNSSLSEVASLVKDECELTGTKFIGVNSTSHNNLKLPNQEIIDKWIKNFNE